MSEESKKKLISPFDIVGDGTLEDFEKYLDAVGVKAGNKPFHRQFTNQVKAYYFTVNGKSDKSVWRVNSRHRPIAEEGNSED